MAKRDHEPLIYNTCRGLYSRDDMVVPPDGYLCTANNLVYKPPVSDEPTNYGFVRVREAFEEHATLPCIPIRFYIYTKSTGNRLILLDANGQFWDSVSGLVILTIPDAIDFHGITLNDRFYISPHNRVTGLPGQVIYVYDPDKSATARKAAGAPMSGVFTVAVSATAGSIEPGLHVVAISYETNSGFRSKPALHQTFTAPASRRRLDLTAIPLGPPETTKRFIWMSQVALNYAGDAVNVPLYLAYTIENNTTTSLPNVVDAFDTQLKSSADEYLDLLPEIPAATFMTVLDGRMITVGAFENPLVMRISNDKDPEAIDSVDGVKEISKGLGGGVKTTRIFKGNILWWKSNVTGIVRPNGDVPANWPVEIIDGAMGAEVYGVSEVLNVYGVFYEAFLVANEAGLHVFNATYQNPLRPLSYNIAPNWHKNCTISSLNQIRVIVDPTNCRLYVIVFNDEDFIWFFGDFSDGLTYDGIKWSIWDFDYPDNLSKSYIDAHTIIDNNIHDTGTTLLAIVDGSNKLRKLIANQIGTGIDSDGEFESVVGIKLADPELRWFHINAIKLHAGASAGHNTGAYTIGIEGFENKPFEPDVNNTVIDDDFNAQGFTLSPYVVAFGGDLAIARLMIYVKPIFEEISE